MGRFLKPLEFPRFLDGNKSFYRFYEESVSNIHINLNWITCVSIMHLKGSGFHSHDSYMEKGCISSYV